MLRAESQASWLSRAQGLLVRGEQGFTYRGLAVEERVVDIAGERFAIMAVRDAADLLDESDYAERFVKDDVAPYGVELWPAASMLAERILQGEPGGGRSVIELGAGLGLVSLAAARRGFTVTLTDYEETALAFAALNADRNGVSLAGLARLDWRDPPTGGVRFDRVFAADVLYQLVDHAPILRCVRNLVAPAGEAWVADPGRGVADRFPEMAREMGFHVETSPSVALNHEGNPVEGRLFHLRLQA